MIFVLPFRYHVLDRFATTDRYHTLSTSGSDKERFSDGYTERSPHQYHSKTLGRDGFKSRSDSRKSEAYQHGYSQHQMVPDRFPPIPCPERFASPDQSGMERPVRIQDPGRMQDDRPVRLSEQSCLERSVRVPFSQVPYLEPPSPAPASDRFIPPPPLSPAATPSPDCYPNNPFPSPTTHVAPPDRFIPPPPLSPSPTEAYSPKKYDRNRYSTSPAPMDRYYNLQEQRNRAAYYYQQAYADKFGDRFGNDR